MTAATRPISSLAAAPSHAPASRPLELLEARQLRDSLKLLLRTEQAAMADFLVALADFDRRRGWEALGHANLFAFLRCGLGLSAAPTFWRQEAARLLQRFPDLEGPLRQGTLCLTTMAELAKVLTAENRETILPRFMGVSSREAKEIVAELQPREAPATRTVVTRVPWVAHVSTAGGLGGSAAVTEEALPTHPPQAAFSTPTLSPPAPGGAPPSQLWAPKVDFGGVAAPVARRDEVEPLSAERSRLHVSVSREFTRKLETARRGLGHTNPHATMEQVLEAALDLLLEKQARARGQLKRPRSVAPTTATAATPTTATAETPTRSTPSRPTRLEDAGKTIGAVAATPSAVEVEPDEGAEPVHRRDGPRQAIPAAVRRAVWERDQGRCSWPLDGGGRCGSTRLLEFDHIHPWARDGEPTVANLRVVCHAHNALAARRAIGKLCVERYRTGRRP